MLDVMAGRIYRPPKRIVTTGRPQERSSTDGLIRSVLTSQPMTTRQVMRALETARYDVGLTIDQLRIRLRGMANRGTGVLAVQIPGSPTEWAAL
jgi:hypothetical protein